MAAPIERQSMSRMRRCAGAASMRRPGTAHATRPAISDAQPRPALPFIRAHAASVLHFAFDTVMVRYIWMRKNRAAARRRPKPAASQHSLRVSPTDARMCHPGHSSDNNARPTGGSARACLVSITACRPFPTGVMGGRPFGVARLARGFGKRARRSYNWHNRTTDPVPRTRDDSNDDKRVTRPPRPHARALAQQGGRQWQ